METEFEFCSLERVREMDVAAAPQRERASHCGTLSDGYDGKCDVTCILQ